MNYLVSIWIVQCRKRIYIITAIDKKVASLCTIRVYRKEKTVYIERMESISSVRGLGRMALIMSIERIVETLKFPEVYIYSRPVESKYLKTERPISHPVQLSEYWKSVMDGVGYRTTKIGHTEAKNGMYRNALAEHRGIKKCLGRIKDEPISRAIKNSPESRMSEIMTILCSSRDLTGGTLLLCKKEGGMKEESLERSSNSDYIHKITREDRDAILNNIEEASKYLLSMNICPFTQSVEEDKIPQKPLAKVVRVSLARKKEQV